QYAVAMKSVREPARRAPDSEIDGRLAPRESMTVASYMRTKPATVNAVASSFLRREREKCTCMRSGLPLGYPGAGLRESPNVRKTAITTLSGTLSFLAG